MGQACKCRVEVAFGSGTWMLARMDVFHFVQAAAWLPWMFWFADRAQVARRTRDRFGLVLCPNAEMPPCGRSLSRAERGRASAQMVARLAR